VQIIRIAVSILLVKASGGMATPYWFVSLIRKFFPARFWAARLTRIPLLGKMADLLFFEGDEILYLPRDTSVAVHQPVERGENVVLPSGVVEHFIKTASHRWIMDFCLCRSANGCKDYPPELGCIFLGEAVLKINPRFGRLATVDEAMEHARRGREAGLVHMVGRNKVDSIWLGATPAYRLLTICNCCPCCCLWKLAPDLNPSIGSHVKSMPGVQVQVTENCIGCGKCTRGVCFVDAISLVDGRAVISSECRGCGRCVEVCPQHAIELTISDSQFLENSIQRISARVRVE
jgi:ferredoxin